jgi:hypothetical protein
MNRKKVWTVAKINFRFLLPAYIITATLLIIGVWNLIASSTGITGNYYVEMGNYLYAIPVFAPIFIVGRNFKRIMNLNGKKHDYYWACLINYVIIAAAASFLNIVLFSISKSLFGSQLVIQSLAEAFGWLKHGVIVGFFQQFFFLLLIAVFVHMLTEMQCFWFGWVTDVLLIAIISVFTPIPLLRNILIAFFNMIIFCQNALMQIVCCLILTACFYILDLLALRRK